MLAERLPVVRGEDDDGALRRTRALQRLEQVADPLVDAFDLEPVEGAEEVDLPGRQVADLAAQLVEAPARAVVVAEAEIVVELARQGGDDGRVQAVEEGLGRLVLGVGIVDPVELEERPRAVEQSTDAPQDRPVTGVALDEAQGRVELCQALPDRLAPFAARGRACRCPAWPGHARRPGSRPRPRPGSRPPPALRRAESLPEAPSRSALPHRPRRGGRRPGSCRSRGRPTTAGSRALWRRRARREPRARRAGRGSGSPPSRRSSSARQPAVRRRR